MLDRLNHPGVIKHAKQVVHCFPSVFAAIGMKITGQNGLREHQRYSSHVLVGKFIFAAVGTEEPHAVFGQPLQIDLNACRCSGVPEM